jgi:hypothetical protein
MNQSAATIRAQSQFSSIPYAFFNRDDWNDLDRGVTWSETEVSEGEDQRFIRYQVNGMEEERNAALDKIYQNVNLPKGLDHDKIEELRDEFNMIGHDDHNDDDDDNSDSDDHDDDVDSDDDVDNDDDDDDGIGQLEYNLVMNAIGDRN